MTQANGAPQTQALAPISPFQARAMELRENISSAEPTAIVPRTFAEAQAFASAIAQSDLVPQALRDAAPNVLMMLLAGAELGLAPVASLRMFHVIEGVPKLSADAIAALCMRSPVCEYLEPRVQTNERVTWATKRRDRPHEVIVEVTQEDIERAGLTKPTSSGKTSNHVKYPRAMKNARCKAEICRLVYPEICAGLLSAEEARDVIDVEFTEKPATSFAPLPVVPREPESAPEVKPVGAAPVAEAAPEAKPEAAPSPKSEPSKPGALTADQVQALGAEMMQAQTPKELAAIAGRIAGSNMTDDQRKELLAIFRSCGEALRKAGSK